ncbi:MAG: type II secretion system protein [bacterium]
MSKAKYFSRGFSLVEMLVAIGIFMSIMTLAITALITIISVNKKAQIIKNTMDNVTFIIEDISRNMRTGTEYWCSPNGTDFPENNKDCSDGGKAVKYKNISDIDIVYKFDKASDNILTKREGTDPEKVLISKDSNVNIDNMTFYVIGADDESNAEMSKRTQPRVIITVSGKISAKGSVDTTFDLQTSISQRMRRE